jgi:hypothetical protein
MYSGISRKELKVILDRTFALWDSFVQMLLKADKANMNILGELFKEYSFKKQFLSIDELANFYNSLYYEK